jgi:hypothetical protein
MAETKLKFDNNGLIPAVVQDAKTLQVLMVAWMNQESLHMTQETAETHYGTRAQRPEMCSMCARFVSIATATRCFFWLILPVLPVTREQLAAFFARCDLQPAARMINPSPFKEQQRQTHE